MNAFEALNETELTSGDDHIIGSAESDVINGLLGVDTFVVDGIRGQFDVTFVGGIAYLTDNVTGNVDKLANIQKIQFDDTVIDLFATDQAEIAALYKVILGRDADDAGLAFWSEQSAKGMSLSDIAHAFVDAAEFEQPSAEVAVSRLYADILGREPDPAGASYWAGVITDGASFATVAEAFIRSAEFADTADTVFPQSAWAASTPWPDDATVVFGETDGDVTGTAALSNHTLTQAGDKLVVFGDATGRLLDEVHGGHDTIVGGITAPGGRNWLIGDALDILDNAFGGNDTLLVNDNGSAGTFTLIGDALFIGGAGRGGNDELIGVSTPSAQNILYGDAIDLGAGSTGGNDRISAGNVGADSGVTNYLYGDAKTLAAGARAGDDVLISGSGNDEIWGDAAEVETGAITGHDIFVFGPGSGKDIIHDFQSRQDRIDVSAYGIHSLSELIGKIQPYGSHGENIRIDFGDGNQVLVIGLPARAYGSRDFIFAVDE
ncbi:conserved hypothetical protein [Chelatococcus asaccharovorans]|nr:conserved hypothetical protein [Chelatococcus asaccharovorans]CAH1676476.1 conserved hypothetical protein [Chelatococcus asaccharovorans]